MRRICSTLLVVFFFSLFIAELYGQNMLWGVKAGANLGTPYMKPKEGATGSLGIGPRLGLFVRHRVNDRFDLQIAMNLAFKGGTYATPVSGDTIYEQVLQGVTYYIPTFYTGWVEGEFGNQYLDFPILARYKSSERFYLLFGPQISYLLKGKNSGTADIDIGVNYSHVTDEPFDESKYINQWDYSMTLGCGYAILKRLNFDLLLSTGLRSIFKDSYDKVDGVTRNIYLHGTFGYIFGDRYRF